ncbi:MAG: CoA ester lyase [Boseongicola sp. SB0676_bin_33]|nr:CoA ester lyase [Boseongicola sp. SB0676_bin_33]
MWRSLLFVPVLEDRLVRGASRRGADALVLDLEAAVPPDRKDEARARLAAVISRLSGNDTPVAVRVNRGKDGGKKDIAAAVGAGAEIIVLPRASPATTARAAALAGHAVPLIPLVEDPRGVIDALAIAEAAPSVAALGFGVEDYATDMGAPPTPELLLPAAFQVIQAARAAGRAPLVVPGTIADYRDLQRFEAAAGRARALGATGGFAIHPGQVAVLNRTFAPTPVEQETARRIVAAAESARRDGQAVASLGGRMIDAPVEARAKAVLAQAKRQDRQ